MSKINHTLNPSAFILSLWAISKVGIDYSTHSCLLVVVVMVVGGLKDTLRNGEMIMQSLGGVGWGALDRILMHQQKLNVRHKQLCIFLNESSIVKYFI